MDPGNQGSSFVPNLQTTKAASNRGLCLVCRQGALCTLEAVETQALKGTAAAGCGKTLLYQGRLSMNLIDSICEFLSSRPTRFDKGLEDLPQRALTFHILLK
jgi:hypothetical protein